MYHRKSNKLPFLLPLGKEKQKVLSDFFCLVPQALYPAFLLSKYFLLTPCIKKAKCPFTNFKIPKTGILLSFLSFIRIILSLACPSLQVSLVLASFCQSLKTPTNNYRFQWLTLTEITFNVFQQISTTFLCRLVVLES